MVIRRHRSFYAVRVDRAEYLCTVSSKHWKSLVYPEAASGSRRQRVERVKDMAGTADPVVVGDLVRVELSNNEQGAIREVLPRHTKFARRASGKTDREQVLVANVDMVVPVFAAKMPAIDRRMLDRFLVTAQAQQLPVMICLNKIDLVGGDAPARKLLEPYERLGLEIITTSATESEGIASLQELLSERLSVLMGPSGVGKSSLLNVLDDGLGLKVREVTERSGRGRHTTVHMEAFPLPSGGAVVDTPGLQRLGLWGLLPDKLPYLMPEFEPYLGSCRFADCAHGDEDGCGVRDAVDGGDIDRKRYESYKAMREEVSQTPRR